MLYKRALLILILVISAANSKAQTVNCFDSCYANLEKEIHKLKPHQPGDTTFTSILSIDESILNGLKGCAFPDKPLYRLDGSIESIKKHKGNLVYVLFTYVGEGDFLPHELNVINKLIAEFKQNDVEFVTLFRDQGDMTEKYLQTVPYSGIVYQIPNNDGFCILSHPMHMLLDKQGTLIKAWAGSGTFSLKAEDKQFNEIKNLIKSNL